MNITRRYFLQSAGALAIYSGVAPLKTIGSEIKPTHPIKVGKTLVTLFLRGGTDGLNFIIPHGEKAYYGLRKNIAIAPPGSKNGALDLDGFFGLHPEAKALKPLFSRGEAVALQAVGYAHNTRSHFEEQDVWETGVIGNTLHSDGWLNRHLATSEGQGPVRAIALGDTLPRILRGKATAYAIRGMADLALPKGYTNEAEITAALEHAYRIDPQQSVSEAQALLAETGRQTLQGIKMLRTVSQKPYRPNVPYPSNPFAKKLKEAARLIKARIGVEVIEIDFSGWDTHSQQGGAQGKFAGLVRTLSEGIAAFTKDMGDLMEDVMILTLSDFGRTAGENGSSGTDHGWANCMLAFGGGVFKKANGKPREVLTQWPGLERHQLYEKRDLLHTTDFRDVIAETVEGHLGNRNIKKVLPQHTFKKVGLLL